VDGLSRLQRLFIRSASLALAIEGRQHVAPHDIGGNRIGNQLHRALSFDQGLIQLSLRKQVCRFLLMPDGG